MNFVPSDEPFSSISVASMLFSAEDSSCLRFFSGCPDESWDKCIPSPPISSSLSMPPLFSGLLEEYSWENGSKFRISSPDDAAEESSDCGSAMALLHSGARSGMQVLSCAAGCVNCLLFATVTIVLSYPLLLLPEARQLQASKILPPGGVHHRAIIHVVTFCSL